MEFMTCGDGKGVFNDISIGLMGKWLKIGSIEEG